LACQYSVSFVNWMYPWISMSIDWRNFMSKAVPTVYFVEASKMTCPPLLQARRAERM
jgi:hypothetical protein